MQALSEKQIGERTFSVRKLDARSQLQLAWTLGARVGPYIDMRSVESPTRDFLPLLMTLALLKREDAEFVMNTALAAVQVQERGAWAPLMASNGSIMYDDVSIVHLHQLVDWVLEFNLGPFFATLRPRTVEPKGGEQGQNSSGTQPA